MNNSLSLHRSGLRQPGGCVVHRHILHHHSGLDLSLPVFMLPVRASVGELSQQLEHRFRPSDTNGTLRINLLDSQFACYVFSMCCKTAALSMGTIKHPPSSCMEIAHHQLWSSGSEYQKQLHHSGLLLLLLCVLLWTLLQTENLGFVQWNRRDRKCPLGPGSLSASRLDCVLLLYLEWGEDDREGTTAA